MTVLATDGFPGADAANLGALWTNNRNSAGIFSHAVDVDAGGNTCISRYNGVTWPADQYSQITSLLAPAASQACAAAVRLPTTPANDLDGYYGGYEQAQLGDAHRSIWFWSAGAITRIASEAIDVVAGDILKLTVSGTTLKLFVNGAERLSVTDSTWSVGNSGIYLRHTAIDVGVIDDWEGGDLITSSDVMLNMVF